MKHIISAFLLIFQFLAGSGLCNLSEAFSNDPFAARCARFLSEHMSSTEKALVPEEIIIENIRYSVKARNLMPWGRSIPEDLFMNYVLPHRISQEPVVNWRPYFFARLSHEVINEKSMMDAALNVLNWFYNRVNYEPSDPRDLDPLSLIRRGRGRCEEINIAVIAGLRSVAIPARHVWVPAWSHTDGNHSWIEVYLDDGKWHYIDPSSCSGQFDSAWFSPYIPSAPVIFTHSLQDNSCRVYRAGPYDRICELTDGYSSTVQISVVPEIGNKTGHDEVIVTINVVNGGRLRPLFSSVTSTGKPVRFSLSPGTYVISAAIAPLPPIYKCVKADSDTRVVIDLNTNDNPSSQSFSCTISPTRNRKSRINSRTPTTCPKRDNQKKLKRVISRWIGEPEDTDVVEKLASVGPSVFKLLSAVENLQKDEKELTKKLISVTPPKELVSANPHRLIEYLRHVKNIADPKIPGHIFELFLLNPRILVEPVDWKLPKIFSLLPHHKGETLFQRAIEIGNILEGIRIQKCALLPPAVTPWQILTSGLACSERDKKIAAVALFRSAGHPAVFIDYAEAVAVYHEGTWYAFNPDDKKNPLRPLRFGELAVKFSGNEKYCSSSPPLRYLRDFCLSKWTGRRFLPVRGAGPVWNKDTCSYNFTLFPGIYDLSVVRRNPPDRNLLLRRIVLKKDEAIQIELP
ncbi:Transglutaminase-like superfamily protein [Thermodesulforhabdus norvegica]|uniref:Transglutaminase-like superfamily protein n=2 Tax=Thermodesulforhabdus norvegica TaxID=39841 RepID=A0A1I4T6N5_9BACT|nr:Transglutaminase-like superfamily protein [Thermodesulforhabdus norvegica]